MHVDGFEPGLSDAFQGFSARTSARFYAFVNSVADRLHVEVEGLDRIPSGRALIVSNHAFGLDVLLPMAVVYRATGRVVWALGEHAWWKVPYLRRLAAAVGTVDGTPQNADRLLAAEQLVVVLPGGLREALKPHELRYRLLWGARYGFVRAAIRNSAPIVPLASIGADEVFDLVGNAFERGERWLGPLRIPIPWPKRGVPIPHRVKLRYVFGDPIRLDTRADGQDDFNELRRARREVEGALQELIDVELARRFGFQLSETHRDSPTASSDS